MPGRRAVRELLVAGKRHVQTVWMARGQDASPLLDEIAELAAAASATIRLVDADRVRAESRIEAPQGVVALAAPVAAVPLGDLTARPDIFLVVLDGITDPRNLGAVLRVAESAGVTGAVLPRHRAASLSPAAVKAAAGAVEHLPIALVGGVPAALEQMSRAGVWTVGWDADAPSSVYELTVADGPVALVFGAEGRGLSRLATERCDVLAAIPRHGHVESLNVSTAAAVACFEVARHRAR
ncbi:MAG: 23S rRNA (guanosine(2251)-2'-O)-methyltransferase RlmB [Acidimicrobiia bacterium]